MAGLLALVPAASATMEEIVETVGSGMVNWTAGTATITAFGIAPRDVTPKAKTAIIEHSAHTGAQHALKNLLLSLPLNGDELLEEKVMADKSLKLRMMDLVLKAGPIAVERFPDGRVSATVSMQFRGHFAVRRVGEAGYFDDDANQEGRAAGMVVDARGVALKPAIQPRLIPEDGTPLVVMREPIYVRGLKAAQAQLPAGFSPQIVKVLRPAGRFQADAVIASEDASLVRRLRPMRWIVVME